jgi:transposase-like protein
MPTPSRFTAERREIILEALRRGNSLSTAAAMARVDKSTLSRWLKRGREAHECSRFRRFAEDCEAAAAIFAGEMVEIIRRDALVEKNAKTAMWWLERRGDEFSPYPADAPNSEGPIVVSLRFSGAPVVQPGLVSTEEDDPA